MPPRGLSRGREPSGSRPFPFPGALLLSSHARRGLSARRQADRGLGFRADLAVHRAVRRARGERPWALSGACGRSGGCCEAPAVSAGPAIGSLPAARRLFLAWQRRVNGFELVSANADAGVFVFRCSHFDRATRSCDSYGFAPRHVPRLPAQPDVATEPRAAARLRVPGQPPNAAGLRAALEKADLTPEQRETLRKGIRLDG